MLNLTDVIKVVKKGHLASVQQHPDKCPGRYRQIALSCLCKSDNLSLYYYNDEAEGDPLSLFKAGDKLWKQFILFLQMMQFI